MTPVVTADPWDVSSPEPPSPADTTATFASLLSFAVLGPSGPNTQPRLFRVRAETVDLVEDNASVDDHA